MVPWLWLWAPQIYFPFSGAVSQNIEPRTDWFARHIPAQAGDAQAEAEITELASYGRQLGMLTNALLGVAEEAKPTSPEAIEALDCLKQLQAPIKAIKAEHARKNGERLVEEIQALKRRGGSDFDAVAKALLPLISSSRRASSRSS